MAPWVAHSPLWEFDEDNERYRVLGEYNRITDSIRIDFPTSHRKSSSSYGLIAIGILQIQMCMRDYIQTGPGRRGRII